MGDLRGAKSVLLAVFAFVHECSQYVASVSIFELALVDLPRGDFPRVLIDPKGLRRYITYAWAPKVIIWELLWVPSIYYIPTGPFRRGMRAVP